MKELSTDEARRRLEVSPQQVRALLRSGRLDGRQLPSGEWLVDEDSLERRVAAKHGPGRNWSSVSSWALLCELSGREEPVDISPRTHARVRERIRLSTAEDIARRVATRTPVRRYDADDMLAAGADMVLTGGAAVNEIDSDLAPQFTTIEGYVDAGEIEKFERDHMLIPDRNGSIVVYENPGIFSNKLSHAPLAVVAADLARSSATRERSAGVKALEEMRQRWLATHMR
jgi:hypothetical protein